MAAKFFVILACLAISHAALVTREEPKSLQDLQNAIKEGANFITSQISLLAANAQHVADQTKKLLETVAAVRGHVEGKVDELRPAQPEATLEGQLQAAVQITVEETVNLAKEHKLSPILEKALEDFMEQAEDLQQKLLEAAQRQ